LLVVEVVAHLQVVVAEQVATGLTLHLLYLLRLL
jgi:hypothetical protein